MEFEAARRRQEDAQDLVIAGAWFAEYIRLKTRSDKRMPPLKSLLHRGEAATKPTREQQIALYHHYAQLYGLRVREQ